MSSPLTSAQVIARLDATRDRLVAGLETLSDDQWGWSPDPRIWSAAHIAEHLAVVNFGTSRLLTERFETLEPASFTAEQQARKDAMIAPAVANRGIKMEAPANLRPKSRWGTRAEIMSKLLSARDAITNAVRNTTVDLRTRKAPHPALGTLDGLQWALFAAEHDERHMTQLDELRQHPDFPAS